MYSYSSIHFLNRNTGNYNDSDDTIQAIICVSVPLTKTLCRFILNFSFLFYMENETTQLFKFSQDIFEAI